MQEINWNNFKAKFNGKEAKAFEDLCYYLFCREFGQSAGIFRYKNQAGIETEPIHAGGELIGFQSKFFESKINPQEIKDSIKTAKGKNPKLNKIYFYINHEFSESSDKRKKEPQYKVGIEAFAKSHGLEIEWRVPSHIEAQLSLDANRGLASFYFSLKKGVVDFIVELTNHTLAILKPIHSEIGFNEAKIKIDRTDTLSKLRSTLEQSPLVILSGAGGVGKTALIKDFHASLGEDIPLFIFKATEFSIAHINELFNNYGDFTLLDFVSEHEGFGEKYVVIDSAEKLSDLENQEAFQEFLSTLLRHHWKIIFTTRYAYLDDLKFQFVEIYRLGFQVLDVGSLEADELENLSGRYNFPLPADGRLLELLKNPFYLNEYLQNYKSLQGATTFSDFKNLLWDKQIARSSYRANNSHLKRERCFLDIAKRRADSGGFFVTADDCADDTLRSLESDEIIKYDSEAGGYFITHDIYEEWALDKFIERASRLSTTPKSFFDSLGSSLPIRRAFRNWLSEKLFNNRDEIKPLIEESFASGEIEDHWKDEILVSVLLSDYSEAFFQMFERVLLEDNQRVLWRAVFLLRIACKEIDEALLSLMGVSRKDVSSIKTIFTKPKGKGWHYTLGFIHRHKEEIGLSNINIILPLLADWNSKNRGGVTTRLASLLGLYYYEEINKQERLRYRSRGEERKQLIGIMLNGSSEVKDELKAIFDEVVSKKATKHSGKHDELVRTVLSSITDALEVAKNLPENVLRLADLYWFQSPDEADEEDRYSTRMDVEDHFCISAGRLEYFPSSAYQTPILQLLWFAPKATIDFILSFTNRAAECYSKSGFGNEVKEVTVFIDETETVKQYISGRLWHAYRGGQTSTYLLESIHMALEKWLLENAKTAPQSRLEETCRYLIKNSRSASITAVVSSVVLAHPSKLFNIAKILFRTKEFFLLSKTRMLLDQSAKMSYSMGYGFNYEHKIHQDERMKTCDDAHRKLSLEELAVNYQFFRSEEETEEVVENRQRAIWEILDKYYAELPDKSEETEADKTWRLYLARMDRRKMHPEVEKHGEHVLIKFNPEIDPELRQFSEESLKSSTDAMRYTSLYLWAKSRFSKDGDEYAKKQQYEDNVQLVISETKDIRGDSKGGARNGRSSLHASIPAYTCSILIRDYFDQLSGEEKEFCREVINEFAALPLANKDYHYRILDGRFEGVEPAIITLPLLIKRFPEHRDDAKSLLLLSLLDDYRGDAPQYATKAILNYLWAINYEDAQSILLGFLLLKPKYDELRDEMRKARYEDLEFTEFSEEEALKRFVGLYDNDLERVTSNKITYEDLGNLELLSLEVLNTAFELIPLKTNDEIHKKIVTGISHAFSENLWKDNDEVDITLKQRFLEKFAHFILSSSKNEIETYVQPFIQNFNVSNEMANLFERFIFAQDSLERYEEFWVVWNLFYERVVEACNEWASRHSTSAIIHNYLFAWPYWNQNARDWHTLREREKLFFKKAAKDMGHHPAVLYSLSKLINEVGSKYVEDGILWISDILIKHAQLLTEELERDTVYYLENLVRKYILTNRKKIKTTTQLKSQVTVILNFLVAKGSVAGYLLREDVL